MRNRRQFLSTAAGWGVLALSRSLAADNVPEEGLFQYIQRTSGRFDPKRYHELLGAANHFKEGDQIVGVAAVDEAARKQARKLLESTRVAEIDRHPLLDDDLYRMIQEGLDPLVQERAGQMTMGQLATFLLSESEAAIHALMPGLSSDVIGCLVKLLDNQELTSIGAKIFNPLPGSQIGAKGYLGARIQPNSPTDNVEDIRWQVLNGWAYAVGDVVLGNNPVSSTPESVHAIEVALKDLIDVFSLQETLPHCVLSHIDVQAEVEQRWPGSTALWFQSIAGSVTANATFDVTIEKMVKHARSRTGRYGLYFETGQGADFTNGHSHGFDMVIHESRKYGFARVLSKLVAEGNPQGPWVHVNDVAGFIGPEVFRTREQLVRCCLEDIVMAKLHGLCIGLDVCSTLHMDVSLDDLDWCLDQLIPAAPAYLMALPTKIDPMLGYLTTGYHDHVRLREKYATKVNDRMWAFFRSLEVIDAQGQPTRHFGDPLWVYWKYRQQKGDNRSRDEIFAEGREQMAAVRSRGLFLSEGNGVSRGDLDPQLHREVHRIYDDSKRSLWAELSDEFVSAVPAVTRLSTRSQDRLDYILHPATGEQLSDRSQQVVNDLRDRYQGAYDVQIVVSDGLNAEAITDSDQLLPYIQRLRKNLLESGFRVAPQNLVIRSGRVRAGYRIGEILFGGLPQSSAILHVIGERPGSGHHTFSVYMTRVTGELWGRPAAVDHNHTRVVAGIATTALLPTLAADETARILKQI